MPNEVFFFVLCGFLRRSPTGQSDRREEKDCSAALLTGRGVSNAQKGTWFEQVLQPVVCLTRIPLPDSLNYFPVLESRPGRLATAHSHTPDRKR